MANYLDTSGLNSLWEKIKALITKEASTRAEEDTALNKLLADEVSAREAIEAAIADDCTLLYYKGTTRTIQSLNSTTTLERAFDVYYIEGATAFEAAATSSTTAGYVNWKAYGNYAASTEYGEADTGKGIIPQAGKLYYNTTDEKIYVWDGTALVALGSVTLWTKIKALVTGEEVARKEADEALSALLYPTIVTSASDLSALDTLGGILASHDDAVKFSLQTQQSRFIVKGTWTSSQRTAYVMGILDVISDSAGHVLTEVLTTQNTMTDGVLSSSGHADGELYQYFRCYNVDSPTLSNDVDTWTEWKRLDTYTLTTVYEMLNESIPQIMDGIAATVDDLPSTKSLYYYVTSEGCFYLTNGRTSKGTKLTNPAPSATVLYVMRDTNKMYRWTEDDGMILLSPMSFADLSDTPTTLSGYGITDGVNAVTVSGVGNAVTTATVSGHTLTLTKGASFLTLQTANNTFLTKTTATSTYLSKTDAASTYLPLAGGTLTGELKTTSNISANKGFILQVDGLSVLTLNSSGNLAIGYGYKSTSATSLQGKTVELKSGDTSILTASSTGVAVTGKVTATGTISGSSSSDERKKENIVETDALALLETLGGVYEFDYKESGEHSVGFIAQRIKEGIFSDIVKDDEDGFKKVDYWSPKLIAAAIGAIGQLSKEVSDLKARVAELENK